jgi:hypothetical protein
MSTRVHHSLIFSMGYGPVGTAHLRNPSPIIMILFPEYPLLVARGRPCLTLGKKNQTR